MTPTPPDRSLDQRRQALATANRIRIARSNLKRLIAQDPDAVLARRLIADPDAVALDLGLGPGGLDSMDLTDVLTNVPGVGIVKARKIQSATFRFPSSQKRRLGGLHPHHRDALVEAVADHAERRRARRTLDTDAQRAA